MYNKIASLILNSGKASGVSDVYVAQPDALKENLAGKVFVLGEIGGKKNDARRVFNFLIDTINDNYYNDEKILLRGKIDGLKIENIFEAALAKTNKSLNEFLLAEKIRLNPAATNLTMGVIYESKLHFSSFGKNRALLIYARGEHYEIINVEANAETIAAAKNNEDSAPTSTPSFFSSVISGEIPLNSYFIFASEALPEYLSAKEMMAIVTKLPPIVAAEQIKNILSKINAYVPFLAVIIKNTAGQNLVETKEEATENPSAQSSISTLNYTEQKTEQMLAPAGLISFSKLTKGVRSILKSLIPAPTTNKKKKFISEEKEVTTAPLDLGKIKSLNLARSDSFMLKEKIFFKKKPTFNLPQLKNIFQGFIYLFSGHFWSELWPNLKQWLKSLNSKNRLLFAVLGAVVVIFVLSLLLTNWQHRRAAAQTAFNNLVTQIENSENLIDSHLLYNDQVGAQTELAKAQTLLASLPHKKTVQQNTYNRLAAKLSAETDQIQKIVKPQEQAKAADLSGLGINNLIFFGAKVYAASANTIYILNPGATSTTNKLIVSGATDLSRPALDNKNLIYYWNNDKLIRFDPKTASTSLLTVAGSEFKAGIAGFKVFNGGLYLVIPSKNQIYHYNPSQGGFAAATTWLKETVDLSQITDFAIDGSVYLLKTDGQVLKFYKGKTAEYKASALSPAMTSASKIIAGTNYLYIFEASSKRLAVLSKKDGTLVNQYQVNSLNQPKDFTVDEASKVAYFLDGESIAKIVLNQ